MTDIYLSLFTHPLLQCKQEERDVTIKRDLIKEGLNLFFPVAFSVWVEEVRPGSKARPHLTYKGRIAFGPKQESFNNQIGESQNE